MSKELDTRYVDEFIARGSQSILERRFIIKYLHDKGYHLVDLKKLPF